MGVGMGPACKAEIAGQHTDTTTQFLIVVVIADYHSSSVRLSVWSSRLWSALTTNTPQGQPPTAATPPVTPAPPPGCTPVLWQPGA